MGRTALRRRIRPRRLPARRRRQTADRRRRQRKNLRRQRRQQRRRRLRKHRAAGRVLRLGKRIRRSKEVRLVVNRCFGTCNPGANAAAKPRVKIALLENGGGVSETEYPKSAEGDTVGPTIYGHAGTPDAISVGAAPFNNSAVVEPYSSHGPVTHYFGPAKSNWPRRRWPQPLEITKPDLVATDCGLTTFFVPTPTPGINRFCGTSAAAPHAAAVAALMRDREPDDDRRPDPHRPRGQREADRQPRAGRRRRRPRRRLRRGRPRRAPARSGNHRSPGRSQLEPQPAGRVRRQPAGDLLLLDRRRGADPVLLAVRARRRRWKTANTRSRSAGPTSPAARGRANPKPSRSTPPPPDVPRSASTRRR